MSTPIWRAQQVGGLPFLYDAVAGDLSDEDPVDAERLVGCGGSHELARVHAGRDEGCYRARPTRDTNALPMRRGGRSEQPEATGDWTLPLVPCP